MSVQLFAPAETTPPAKPVVHFTEGSPRTRLALSRLWGETINLHTSDGVVTVHVVKPLRSGGVRILLEAPRPVRIARSELEDLPPAA